VCSVGPGRWKGGLGERGEMPSRYAGSPGRLRMFSAC
jgi:hypothetical protein